MRVWSTLAETAPYPKSNTTFDHIFSGIVVSPDGQNVYLTSGSRTAHGEEESNQGKFPGVREVPLTAAIFRLPANGANLMLPNDEVELQAQGYYFARGLRNAFDLAFAPNGDLFASENGPDADYPEELNWIRRGHHYGFP
jgi:glucose/arabinose dehydrogenase